MHLDIVSAEEEIFSGTVKNLSAAAMMGEVGIYPKSNNKKEICSNSKFHNS